MAKYCTKCGKKLDGKPCDCENNKNTISTTSNFDVNYLISVIKGMFAKPVDTLQEFIKNDNLSYGLVLIVINAIILGLFSCLGMKELVSFGNTNMAALYIQSSIDFPYAEVFFKTLLIAIVTYVLLAGLFYIVIDKLFKFNSSYKKMITLFGANSIILSITLLGSIILMYVSAQLMLILLCCGMLVQNVYMIQGFSFTSNINRNQLGYIYVITYAIVLIVFTFILPSILN